MRRNLWVISVAVLAIAAVALIFYDFSGTQWAKAPPVPGPSPSAAPALQAKSPPAAPAGPSAATPAAPSFDAVRVGAAGDAVIAGRAAPGAEVTVLNNGKPIGKATADARGEWVIMPAQPFAPGPQQLSLDARNPGTAKSEPSTRTLAVLVPPREPGRVPQPSVAVLLPQSGNETAQSAGNLQPRAARHVTLDVVEYDASGRTVLSGRADAQATVRVFVNDRPLGSAAADSGSNWSASLDTGVPVGRYRLRLDASLPDGSPAGTLDLTLRRAAPGQFASGHYFAVVPGNTLWFLAQHSYGQGTRYVELYRANRDKIENPDLIYPNEFLSAPPKSE